MAEVRKPMSDDDEKLKMNNDTIQGKTSNTKDENKMEFDELEKSVGISVYFDSSSPPGFSAVVKARYSDFLVHEVALDGQMALLTSLDVPKVEDKEDTNEPSNSQHGPGTTNETKNADVPKEEGKVDPVSMNEKKMEVETDTNGKVTQEVKKEKEDDLSSFNALESQLSQLIKDANIAKKVMLLLESHKNNQEGKEKQQKNDESLKENQGKNEAPIDKFVILPALEKLQRKSVHEWVRKSLPSARADTIDGKIRIWHVKFEKEMPNYKAFGTHKNKGTSARRQKKKARANWPSDRPDFLQFVLYKENTDTTSATKEVSRRGSTARIGYAGMKDKRGITSQFCTLYRTTPEEIAKGNKQQRGGGGNTKQKGYSVVQTGNFQYVSKELRLGQLKGNRFDIILRNIKILKEKKDDACIGSSIGGKEGKAIITNDDNNESKRKEVLQRAAKSMKDNGFINYFGTQRFGKFTNTHLVGIAVLQGKFKEAIGILMDPNTDDRPDIVTARTNWQERFKYGENKENESITAKKVLRRLNRFMTAEIAVLQSLAKHPFDYERAFRCIPKNLKMMYVHAVQSLIWNRSTSHRIASMDSRGNIMVGDLVPNVKGEKGSPRVHIVTGEDIKEKRYSLEDVVVPVVGSRTLFPTNALVSVIKQLFSDIGVTLDMFKGIKDKDIQVCGDYRKMIIHPKDFDYTIKEYYDPLQPLLQTDLMKLQGEDIAISPPTSDESPKLIAMIVGFTLPSSSYATIALRELMKSPTSNEFQRQLKLE